MTRRYISLPTVPYGQATGEVHVRCPLCAEVSSSADLAAQAMVCPWCDFHFPLEAGRHVALLVDEGSFRPLKEGLAGPSLFGRATLWDRPIALAVADPATCWTPAEVQACVDLIEEARLQHSPLLWLVTAPRGTVAEIPWAGVQSALGCLREAELPGIALLSGPCYGPAVALALQADLVLAEPGTAITLVPPEELRQAGRLPEEVTRPVRDLLRAGWADASLPRRAQRPVLATLLGFLEGGQPDRERSRGKVPADDLLQPPEGVADLFDLFFELHGDRGTEDDRALLGGLARLREGGGALLFLATARERGPSLRRPREAIGAGGWRKATRLLALAGRFGLPVVTRVDRVALRSGRRDRPAELATAMGQTLAALLALPAPSVALRLGRGGGPASLALTVADSILAPAAIAADLAEEGFTPDGTFTGEELPVVLAGHLQSLTQTYALHGPLGRRKLLQRRHARWTRLAAGGAALLPQGNACEDGS
jgi:acetyl-CoA carboxylase beta subunit